MTTYQVQGTFLEVNTPESAILAGGEKVGGGESLRRGESQVSDGINVRLIYMNTRGAFGLHNNDSKNQSNH